MTNKVSNDRSQERGNSTALNGLRLASAAFGFGMLLLLIATQVSAQGQATLTLEEAIDLARRNNPTYRMTVNNEADADWGVREAYAAFVPSFSVGNSFSYQATGTPRLGNLSAADFGLGATPAVYGSDYRLNANLQISGATFFNAARSKANQRAVEAQIAAAGFDLATTVTRQYLAVLRARDNVTISRSALDAADEALKIAQARQQSGAATRLDLSQAQVDRGRAEVAQLQAENAYDTERVRLMQQMGIALETDVELTSTFDVFEPQWSVEELTATALETHPQLVAAKKSESAAAAAAKAEWSQYLPSISLFGQWSGYVRKVGDPGYVVDQARNSAENRVSNCQFFNSIANGINGPLPGYPQDCTKFTFTPQMEASALAANSLYPFNYTSSPAYFSLSISLPIVDGFTRERRVQTARMAADDAKHTRRAQELTLRTDVTTNLLALRTAYRTVALEEQNAETAGLSLELARERYRLGAGSILELTQAQDAKARADQAHLAAVYSFHESLAALEASVGVALRQNRE
ncbi:MAG: TolC family protein [Gemmatimonadetes bacterium]|nr:TolC family protein [Gemmatimonadota bacterium]